MFERIFYKPDNYFLLHTICEESIEIEKKLDFRYAMNLHILGCPDHHFITYTKFLSGYETNFVAALMQKLMNRIARNFIFNSIFTKIGADYILMPITRKIPLMLEIFGFFNTAV